MARLATIDPADATGRSKDLLDAVRTRLGIVPNMTRGMAANPVVLDAYVGFLGTLGGGRLDARLRELIALAVAEANGCDYCLSAHTAIGGMLKLAPDVLVAARTGEVADPRIRGALQFARRVVAMSGHVTDADLAAVKHAGYDDAEIGEIVANVAINVFTNFFNSVAATDIDFPVVTARRKKAA